MEFPTLMYGNQTWVLRKGSLQCVESTEMRFLRSVKECTRTDRILNHDRMLELEIHKLTKKNQINKTNSLQHLERMEDYKLSKCILGYMPLGRRTVERPRKRWKHSLARTCVMACFLKLNIMIHITSKVSVRTFSYFFPPVSFAPFEVPPLAHCNIVYIFCLQSQLLLSNLWQGWFAWENFQETEYWIILYKNRTINIQREYFLLILWLSVLSE
jgi:hypothetical protein